jgi:tetratricopeptide (TPR) repeat protein
MRFFRKVALLFSVVAVAVPAATFAAQEDGTYPEIISASARCRDLFWEGVDAIGERELGEARVKLERAVKEDDGCFLAYLLLSQLEYAEGNDEKSTEFLQRIPPEPPELRAMYEDVAAALRADDYDAAAAKAEDLVAAYPQTITAIAALHLLARAEYHLGRGERARGILKVAYMYSDLAPGTVPAYGSEAEAEELEKFAGLR